MLTDRRGLRHVSLAKLPEPAELDEYATASEEIEGRLRSLPGIVAIYRTGGLSSPGISDLDSIAVVERPMAMPEIWQGLSERARFLAMHGPFLVDLPTFRRHLWFAHLQPLTVSFGSAVDLEARPVPHYSEPLMGAESLVVCLLRVLKAISTGYLKVRALLCGLNNVRHGLALARLDQANAPLAWGVADDVSRLRHTWFTLSNDERTASVLKIAGDAPPALLEALWILGQRTSPQNGGARTFRLNPPWSNVTLVPTRTLPGVNGKPPRLPLLRSARLSEMRWRAKRPVVPVHPGVLDLLWRLPTGHQRDFRLARNELVRAYVDFFTSSGGSDYSPIGFASYFLNPDQAGISKEIHGR
jgi:hypothetical protein